ncbi:MAG: glycosyltransferase family 2 protein [Panacagrimonas sp.]
MKPGFVARLRGALRLLRPHTVCVPTLRPARNVEPIPSLDDGWRALDDAPRLCLDFGGNPPPGLLRLQGSVERYDGSRPAQKFIFCSDASGTEGSAFEWHATGDPGFAITLYVPLWCHSLHWQPVDAPGVFQAALDRVEHRGLALTLGRLMADRWRLRWHRVLPSVRRAASPLLRMAMKAVRATLPANDYAWLRRQMEPELAQVLAPVRAHQARMRQRPAISLVMAVKAGAGAGLERSLHSVIAQTWQDWTLLLAGPDTAHSAVTPWLLRDPRIQWHGSAGLAGSEIALADVIRAAPGEFVCIVDQGDALSALALYTLAATLERYPGCELAYSDEDRLDPDGTRRDPVLKSGWNPELLECGDYIGGLAAFRTAHLEACGGWRDGFGRSAAYDLLLRFTRGLDSARIRHVPAVLYHRAAATALADADSQRALEALRQVFSDEPGVRMEPGLLPATHRVRRPLPRPVPRVSIIVPSRDGGAHLRTCVGSLFAKTDYPDFELLLVDNQSTAPDTLAFFAEMAACRDVRVLPYPAPFNYSAINNLAAREASGSALVLLNDDTEVLTPEWLHEMVALACRPDVGAVGAKLYYPDGTIQHGGVGLGIGGVAGHLHLGAAHDADGYLGRLKTVQAIGAVTGACLAVERRKFEAVGGLDEVNLHVALNDIDLCIKLAERGWRCVWTPYAELVHHESKSRGKDTTPEKQALFRREHATMRQRWPRQLADDPYYHRHLSRTELDLGFCSSPRPYQPWSEPADRHATEDPP